jgi:hypothetical protein
VGVNGGKLGRLPAEVLIGDDGLKPSSTRRPPLDRSKRARSAPGGVADDVPGP